MLKSSFSNVFGNDLFMLVLQLLLLTQPLWIQDQDQTKGLQTRRFYYVPQKSSLRDVPLQKMKVAFERMSRCLHKAKTAQPSWQSGVFVLSLQFLHFFLPCIKHIVIFLVSSALRTIDTRSKRSHKRMLNYNNSHQHTFLITESPVPLKLIIRNYFTV